MDRVLVFDNRDNPVMELAPGDVFGRVRTEEINGIHSLEITTTHVLQKNQRVLTCDAMGKWREYVVEGVDALHEAGERPIGTYYCEWSVQHDLTLTHVSRMPGVQSPVPAAVACEAALSGTNRWSVGTVTCTKSAGASMYDMSGWEAMSVLVQAWGCEIEPEIGVDETGVISRKVAVLSHVGSETATRRFDYGSDLVLIMRSVSEEPVYARISPRGAGEEVGDSYGRRITIESVNGGVDWLQNNATAELLKVPDGDGGWEYPIGIVENPDIDDPQELKDWGLSVLEDYTTPDVTYQASVLQYQKAGMDIKGISLGDDVQCVDRKFGEEGLRISGRVVSLIVNELDETDAQATIGKIQKSVASALAQVTSTLGVTEAAVRAMNGGTLSTASYLSRLLGRLNAEINATGGYTYITEGQGLRTYDRAVSDPLVGSEASKVVELKGGSIRIADSKTSAGEWEWKTVIVSGHIAAELVTAANLTAGMISSADGTSYWNLDTGQLVTRGMTAIDVTASGSLSSTTSKSKVDIRGGYLYFGDKENATDASWRDAGTMLSANKQFCYIERIDAAGNAYFAVDTAPTFLYQTATGKAVFSVSDGELYLGFPFNPRTIDGIYSGDLKIGLHADLMGSLQLRAADRLLLACGTGEVFFQYSPSGVNFSNNTLKNVQIDPNTGGASGGVTGTYSLRHSNGGVQTITVKNGLIVG